MARKTRQSTKPIFATLCPTPLHTKQTADRTASPLAFPFSHALQIPNARLIHDRCAEATRPSEKELARVQAGNLVKVKFMTPLGGERMWVIVTARDGDDFTGTLDNIPEWATNLRCGDTVKFTRDEVVGIGT